MSEDFLANLLVDRRFLPRAESQRLLNIARITNTYLENVLIREKVFSREKLLQILENFYFCPSIEPGAQEYRPEALALIPEKLAERHMALPLQAEDGAIQVAMAQPDNGRAVDALAQATQRQVIPVVALRHELKSAIDQFYGRLRSEKMAAEAKLGPLMKPGRGQLPALPKEKKDIQIKLRLDEDDTIAFVDTVINEAIKHGASDIHVQPAEGELLVRYRIDDAVYTVARAGKRCEKSIISRMKIISGMDIAEKRVPQDGRHSTRRGDEIVDLRVSCVPAQFGEKIVMRLLRKDVNLLNLDKLQMPPPVREGYDECLTAPLGMYLVTGPTGSGKTTTLYATLNALDREGTNIITLEDPIEYTLPGLTQVQVHESVGLTFAAGLRSFLRQDPDVILVGEIRDLETVEIASRAALTGHKVFSTLHTNDSCQAITRLVDMGAAPYLIAATVRGILAQRLIRRICPACKTTYEPTSLELAILGYPKIATLARGAGCQACVGTGYKGRRAIYEYFKVTPAYHPMIMDGSPSYAIRQMARRNGMILLPEFARREILDGGSTVDEMQRVVISEDTGEQICGGCGHSVSTEFMVCPFCKKTLRESCEKCGGPIDPSWEACPGCGAEIEREWQRLYCPRCMAPVESDWESCHYCGEGLK